ncbi:MAG TPA: hypothetical protein VF270_07135 [Ignavibacteriaceae bacterium]
MKKILTYLPIFLLICAAISFILGVILQLFFLLAVGGFCGMFGMASFFWRIAYFEGRKRKKK